MTDYSKMTDKYINIEVCLITGDHGPCGDIPDYCNDWAAIGPIVQANNINLTPESDGRWAVNPINKYTYNEEPIYDAGFTDENPKRAAAICFLMMQEEG